MLQEIDQFASVVLGFDSKIYRLGNLCKRGHDYKGTGGSLRYKSVRGCLECQKENCYKWKKENSERFSQIQKDFHNRHKNRRNAAWRDYYRRTKDVRKQYQKRYIIANLQRVLEYRRNKWLEDKDKMSQSFRKWSKTDRAKKLRKITLDKRRAKKNNCPTEDFTPEQLNQHLSKFNDRCAYCDKFLDPNEKGLRHLDHFIAINSGGGHLLSNLVLSCSTCNLSKRDSNPYVWFKSTKHFNIHRWLRIKSVLYSVQKVSQIDPGFLANEVSVPPLLIPDRMST